MFILFLSYFGQFVISSVQFALHIYGVDEDLGIPSEFLSLIGAIRRFAAILFSYRIYTFYWQKLFADSRNILCHHDFLEQFTENSNDGDSWFIRANPAEKCLAIDWREYTSGKKTKVRASH